MPLSSPTVEAVENVARRYKIRRWKAVNYLEAMGRGNLICWACGSENHTEGHPLCNATPDKPGGATAETPSDRNVAGD